MIKHIGWRVSALLGLWMLCIGATAITATPPGTFAVHVAIAKNPAFVKEWMRTPSTHPITIPRIREAHLGQTVHIAFIVTGHRADGAGVPDLAIDVVVRQPDGSILMDERPYARVAYHTGEGGFGLGDPVLDLVLEAGDPTGTWIVEATARDARSGTRASATATLDVKNDPGA